MWVMLISGALSGLAGAMLIVGPYGKIEPSIITLGYGYAGIVVAALARNNLGLIIVSGILFSGLRVGGNNLQVTTDTPIHIGVMLQGAILLFALGGEAFRRYHIHIVRVHDVSTKKVAA
jgi:simple sugar transport system permease protein